MNTGWIGFAVYCYAFVKPVILLTTRRRWTPVKVCIATLFCFFTSPSLELFLPTSWMFLGIAYWYLDKFRANRIAAMQSASGRVHYPRTALNTVR